MEPLKNAMQDPPVHVILRFPFPRPPNLVQPNINTSTTYSLEEKVWRFLQSLPGPDEPWDILAELEHDQVTFDWELLAETLGVPLSQVFEAASRLFLKHMGRPLTLVEDYYVQREVISIAGPNVVRSMGLNDSEEEEAVGGFERTELRSVESLGRSEESAGSPAVELSTVTPRDEQLEEDSLERQSMIAEAMADHVEQQQQQQQQQRAPERPQAEQQSALSSKSSSFSDLSNNSLSESAMQDAMLAEAMNGSTVMSSILGSRMFPWTKRRR
ncbi:hypothetical protein LPJ64_005586 [Coemansia asiatica]|uniref:Autophagy-related protein 29 n=1 Tax=Coemansia asiatica TaxID=1052880 RepID=A0A9W7XG64_9FUNG|nr:hypothetical protein LPJ64_005586 [Coemansia asiatica]